MSSDCFRWFFMTAKMISNCVVYIDSFIGGTHFSISQRISMTLPIDSKVVFLLKLYTSWSFQIATGRITERNNMVNSTFRTSSFRKYCFIFITWHNADTRCSRGYVWWERWLSIATSSFLFEKYYYVIMINKHGS